ncbi:head GIN domain-containing protein [Georgenia sp. SYP-B2076]|uniref:head GIN domain-containing protein n=1 Tax=Georgenia sp. SYP-B2076 TaxID=2495881 RepID=UPI0013DF5FB8|nr:head GIN domain-containing protein [Georgenia sp. SYP-B2076]
MDLRKVAFWAVFVTAPTLALAGCGTALDGRAGAPTTQEREVEAVTAVSLAATGHLDIRAGATPSLRVTAGEDVIDRITTDVRDGVLVLGMDDAGWRHPGEITYELVLPAVDTITVAGAGDVDADLVPTRTLAINLDGAGDITARGIDVDELTVRVGGAGGITLTGAADRQVVAIDGLGEYDGDELTARDADVSIGGAGDAHVRVTDTLSATVDGAGEITHSGGAHVVSEVSGVGDVREA